MDNYITVFVSAIVSGICATGLTIWWQNRSEKRSEKRAVFKTLMAYRFMLTHAENVKALNKIQVLFFNDDAVRKAWEKFKSEVDRAPSDGKKINDAHIKLLEEVGKACGYKRIKWDEIKNYYYPQGLADEIDENNRLRKANLQMIEKTNQQVSGSR